jgi:hypothetical protein
MFGSVAAYGARAAKSFRGIFGEVRARVRARHGLLLQARMSDLFIDVTVMGHEMPPRDPAGALFGSCATHLVAGAKSNQRVTKRASRPFEMGCEYRAQFARLGAPCHFSMVGAHAPDLLSQ